VRTEEDDQTLGDDLRAVYPVSTDLVGRPLSCTLFSPFPTGLPAFWKPFGLPQEM
jgi:hypothetical protein